MRTIKIDGKTYLWADVRRWRREQIAEARRVRQLTLFELKDDARPKSQRKASGRFEEPLLFKG